MSCVFFFFKQKTAYEMRISDWSSDVCSSDLPMLRTTIATPMGALAISGDGERLTRLAWAMDETPGAEAVADDPLLREARRQIEAWFAGRLTRFDLPLTPAASPRGAVLRAAIVAIPHGETASYGQVARSGESGQIGSASCRERECQYV